MTNGTSMGLAFLASLAASASRLSGSECSVDLMLGFGLFALALALVMVGGGWLIYRDLAPRGVDPVPVILLTYFLWPVGIYVWMKRRRASPIER